MATKFLLIVDDSYFSREALAVVLRRDGYEVISATNGAEAIAILGTIRPDLILLDMLMPVLDGWQVLQQLKVKNFPPVPIILVTATGLTRKWAEDHGCCGFISKPIVPIEVLKEVRRCLEERAPSDRPAVRYERRAVNS
jgi:two-component system, OmpR family, response regulator ResD